MKSDTLRDLVTVPSLITTMRPTLTHVEVETQTDPSALVIWCPADVTLPTPNQNGCSGAFRTLDELWAALVDQTPTSAGTIWLGKNYHSAPTGDGNLLLDGQSLEQMAQYDLIVQGGWDGLGKGTLDLARPSTLDGVSLLILNWEGNVSLNNLRIQDASSGRARAAICIRTTGSIQLEHVRANHSLYGTSLDNTASVSSPPAAVTVSQSDFSTNDYAGLSIYTNGAVTLDHVIASHNVLGYGIKILNSNYEVASSVTVSDGQFHQNSTTGLLIQSNGPITLNNLHARENGRTGISADNRHGVEDVWVDGINLFLGNGRHGLEVYSNGAITARSLTAIANQASGCWLLTTVSTQADTPVVQLTEIHADRNRRAGVEIYADGQVNLVNSSTYQNIYYGLYVRSATDKYGPAPALTLDGFLSDLNGTNEDLLTSAPVARKVFPYGMHIPPHLL